MDGSERGSQSLNPAVKGGVILLNPTLFQHFLQFPVADALFTVPTHGPQDDVALKMPLFEIVGHGMSLLRVRVGLLLF